MDESIAEKRGRPAPLYEDDDNEELDSKIRNKRADETSDGANSGENQYPFVSKMEFSFAKIFAGEEHKTQSTATSLEGFLRLINGLNENDYGYEYAFRGDAKIRLSKPSLFRDGGILAKLDYYNHIIQLAPEEFSNRNAFDILSKMQHYNIPTRLLDFTSNPLVALYFACKDNNEDGKVEVVKGRFFHSDLHEIQIICLVEDFLARYLQVLEPDGLVTMKLFYDFLLKKNISFGFDDIDYLNAILEVGFIGIRPNHTNPRLSAQQGLFLLFGIGDKSSDPNRFPLDRLVNPPSIEYENKYIIKIPSCKKNTIRKQLEKLGVDLSRLYPELEHISEFVKQSVDKEKKSP